MPPRERLRRANILNRWRLSEKVQPYLPKSNMKITWPLSPPYRDEPFALLDEIAAEK